MEYFTTADTLALDKCLGEIAGSNMYVGIIARRYGFVPDGHETSITELEYQAAAKAGITALVFLLADDMDWPAEFTDVGNDGERLRTFREHLKLNKIVGFFRNPDNLAAQVTAIVANTAGTRQAEDSKREHKQNTSTLHCLHKHFFRGRRQDCFHITAFQC